MHVRQGKAPRTVSKHLLDSIAAGGDAEQPSIAQLASDFQLGPPGSVRLNWQLTALACHQIVHAPLHAGAEWCFKAAACACYLSAAAGRATVGQQATACLKIAGGGLSMTQCLAALDDGR